MDEKKREEIKAIVRSEINRILVEGRESAQLTIEAAAKIIGCEVETLKNYEAGDIQPLKLIQILKAYGISELTAYEKLNEISFKIAKLR